MMLKSEDDDGYCSRSSLDSPVHTIKVETISGPGSSLSYKEEQVLKNNTGHHSLYASPSFLEVMLTRDDWKKSNSHLTVGSHNPSSINSSLQISQKSDEVEVSKRFTLEKASEKEYQPRKTIKLMPSSSQNLLLFTKQSALSGLVVSSKPNVGSNSVTFHSLIKNNHNISIPGSIGNIHLQSPTNKRLAHLSNNQPIKLTAAEVLKSKINNHPNISEVQKKLQASKLTPCHAKKVISGKDSSSQGSNSSFTSARTGQPYVRNSKGGGWGGRPSPYVGRHELHPVIDHDYCEFSAFNAEIQSGIILMSRETCARTDRLNMKRNKASLQPPTAMAALSPSAGGTVSATSFASSAKSNIGRGADMRTSCSHQLPQINQSNLTDNKRKYLKRKYNGSPMEAPSSPVVKNAVGRPRLSGKTEKNQATGKRSSGYDSSDDLSSPPLTEDKNYVKIPGSFQNDFVYYATIRGRSSRKRHSENKSTQPTSSVQKNSSMNNSIKAFEWYKEMANTDKSIRFGSSDGTSESTQHSLRSVDDKQAKLDIGNLFSASLEEGKSLISESEVADLVMQMLPSPEAERNSFFHGQFLGSPTSDSPSRRPSSAEVVGSDGARSLADGIVDIGYIDLAAELGNMLDPEEKQDSSLDRHGLHSLDFPTMTSSQLLEDLCENDLLMSTEMVNMNAFLNEFSDDQNDMCGGVESDADLSSMIRADVMGLLASPGHKASSQPTCLTPPDSATIDSNGSLSFPCDLKEFQLDDTCRLDDSSQSTGELSSLLTPPPSLSPSSAPPELTTVNMFWNDLPGLLIEGREYVRLVDIHKQIMPAKDTGILKKRCIMLGLEVSSCSELQRDFLIRYMNAAKSKSKVIVTKDTALNLISFYINPKTRSLMMAGKDSVNREKSCDGLRVDNLGDVLKDIPLPNSPSVGDQQQHQSPGKTSAECTKRSARLLNKRFSYLDMVNNGLPVSLRTSNVKSSSKQNIEKESPIEDLQQQWLDLLEKKFSQNAEDESSSLTEELDSTQVVLDREEEKLGESQPIIDPEEDLLHECEIDGNTEESMDGTRESQNDSPLPPQISDDSNRSFEEAGTDLPSELITEEASDSAIGVDSRDGEIQLPSESLNAGAGKIDLDELGSCDSMNSGITASELFEELGSSPRKSERILRSSTCSVATETAILASKNDSSETRHPIKTFPTLGNVRQCTKQEDEPSNENQSPRLIRSKRHLLRPLSSSNTHGKKASRASYKEGASLNARARDEGKMPYAVPQSRPNRQARRKFDVLKF